jgi:hypothetical protein
VLWAIGVLGLVAFSVRPVGSAGAASFATQPRADPPADDSPDAPTSPLGAGSVEHPVRFEAHGATSGTGSPDPAARMASPQRGPTQLSVLIADEVAALLGVERKGSRSSHGVGGVAGQSNRRHMALQ